MEYQELQVKDYPEFLNLYVSAFPPDERREYKDERHLAEFIRMKGGKFHAFAAKDGDLFIGFLSYWTFEGYTYIEHFAVKPENRGKRIGSDMLDHLFKTVSENVLIEVERPLTNDAIKRIQFYQRNGFRIREEIKYVQPPYSPLQDPVPMLLMTHGNVNLHDISSIKDMLREVYNVNYSI